MILCSLSLENFKSYRSKSIQFAQGLVGIIGRNGSGKSTIFEAILFALYGELKQRGWKDTIRNADATTKDVVSCELVFEIDMSEYKLRREFRGKALTANAKLYKNKELVVSGAKDVTKAIVALTKMSKEAFMHTLFASQKELTSLSSLNNENRKKMIRKLLGLEKIDFIEGVLVENIRNLKRDIKSFAEVLMSVEDIRVFKEQKEKNILLIREFKKEQEERLKSINRLKKVETELKEELVLLQKTKDQQAKAFSNINLLKNTISSNTINQKRLSSEIKELEAKERELEKKIAIKKEYQLLCQQIKEQEKLKEFHLKKEGLQKEQVQLRVQYTKTKAEIQRLEKESSWHDKLILELKTADESLNSLKKEIMLYHAKKTKLQKLIAGEQKLIEDTNKKIQNIKKLGANSSCPTCTRALLEEYELVLNSLKNIVDEIQKNKIDVLVIDLQKIEKVIVDLELKKDSLDKEHKSIAQKINLIESKKRDLQIVKKDFELISETGKVNKLELEKLANYSYDKDSHSSMIKAQNEQKLQYEYVLSLETMLKRLGKIKDDFLSIGKKIDEQKSEYATKESEYKAIVYDEKEHVSKQNIYEKTTQQREENLKELNTIEVKVASINGEINTIQSRLDDDETKVKKLQQKKDDLEDFDKIKVALGEFKTKINSKIAPSISKIASNMYATITKGRYQHIEVSNDFDFYIYDDGKKYPIERFSGGEIDLANLVLRIAISKTLAELNGANSVEFLAFDEVFGSQDESRRMEILEAFHTIKEQYRQIFLISHEMEIKEMFENIVEL